MLDFMDASFVQKELKFVALAASGILAGTALYITIVETKTRKNLDTQSMRRQWSDSFDSAAHFVVRLFLNHYH